MASPLFSSPPIGEYLKLIEEGLKRFLDSDVRTLLEVGSYITDGGGKRLRPLLVLSVSKAGGTTEEVLKEKVLPLAVGIEYIHTASLLHDDVVDEADTRRGRPAAHRVFGNGVAVLTGDYMYANALYLFATNGTQKMIEVVSQAVKTMAEGQVLELKKVGELIDEGTYFKIIDGKTAVLFAAAAAVGALSSPALAERWEELWRFGLHLGRAFQLIDDALDYIGDEKAVGKPVGQDLREGKTTYPLLAVIDKLDPQRVKEVLLGSCEGETEEIISLVKELGGVEKTKERARQELSLAGEILEKLPLRGQEGEFLKRLLEFVVERTY